MKTTIKTALVSALTLMIAAQPAYGMQSIKEQFKKSRIAQYASVVTFVGLITGNKKMALAGACVLPIGLMTPEQRIYLAQQAGQLALQNWKTIAGVVSLAGLGYSLWELYAQINLDPHFRQTSSQPSPKITKPSQISVQPQELNYDLQDTFMNDVLNNDTQQEELVTPTQPTSPITSPRIEHSEEKTSTTPLGSPRTIPHTDSVVVDSPKKSYQTPIAKLASQLDIDGWLKFQATCKDIFMKSHDVNAYMYFKNLENQDYALEGTFVHDLFEKIDAPKESYETTVAKLASQLDIFVKTNNISACIEFNDMLQRQDPKLACDALKYNNHMLAKSAQNYMLTKKTVFDAYKKYLSI